MISSRREKFTNFRLGTFGTFMSLIPAMGGERKQEEWKCRRCGKEHYGKNWEGHNIVRF